MHGVTGFLLVLSLVVAAVGAVMSIMDRARDFKVKWEQMKSTERKDEGVEIVRGGGYVRFCDGGLGAGWRIALVHSGRYGMDVVSR